MKTPETGQLIVTLSAQRDGTITRGRVFAVEDRNRFAVLPEEFVGDGSRHNVKSLFPNSRGEGTRAPLSHSPRSLFLLCHVEQEAEARAALAATFIDCHRQVAAELRALADQCDSAANVTAAGA